MAKKKTRFKYRRVLILGMLCFSAYLVFTLSTSIYQIMKLQSEVTELKERKTAIEEQNRILNEEITRLQDSEYVSRYARANYMFTKEGETIIILPEEDSQR